MYYSYMKTNIFTENVFYTLLYQVYVDLVRYMYILLYRIYEMCIFFLSHQCFYVFMYSFGFIYRILEYYDPARGYAIRFLFVWRF